MTKKKEEPFFDPSAPDTFTASDTYAARFSGETGKFFLDVQEKTILSLLKDLKGKRILEIGGAHAQLTRIFLKAGCDVWVHATDPISLTRLNGLKKEYPDTLHLFDSSMFDLPFEDKSFDSVVAIRLISHVQDWQKLLLEMCRVSKQSIVIDYPPKSSFNIFYPILFSLKKTVEGEGTRTFLRFSPSEIQDCLKSTHFEVIAEKKQFFLPMAFHRMIRCARLSRCLEGFFGIIGLTDLLGSPTILYAERCLIDIL